MRFLGVGCVGLSGVIMAWAGVIGYVSSYRAILIHRTALSVAFLFENINYSHYINQWSA